LISYLSLCADDSDLGSVSAKIKALEYDIENIERKMRRVPDQKTKDLYFRRLESKEKIAIALRNSMTRLLNSKEINEASRQERIAMLLESKKIGKYLICSTETNR
jgi:hypothetical protein